MIKSVSTDAFTKVTVQDIKKEKLQKACAAFESLFINQLLKSMRSSVTETGFLGNSEERKIVRSMFDQKLAERLAENSGIGLSRILFENLKNRYI
jgi:peptidoglycan hydrolase FlgJ